MSSGGDPRPRFCVHVTTTSWSTPPSTSPKALLASWLSSPPSRHGRRCLCLHGGATQAQAGLLKNDAAIKKTEAANKWEPLPVQEQQAASPNWRWSW